jgi:hypothetical protein
MSKLRRLQSEFTNLLLTTTTKTCKIQFKFIGVRINQEASLAKGNVDFLLSSLPPILGTVRIMVDWCLHHSSAFLVLQA